MKKLYFGLILLSDFMSASQHSATKMNSLVMYQQDVAQLQQKAKSRSLQELRQATDYTYKKREECGKQIAKLNSDSAFMHGQIIGLQSMVSSQNKRYQEEYQRPFDPQRSVHVAQAALTRYEKLSYEQQKQQAENSVLEEVACTPEGIKQYWQRQINGDFSVAQDLFFQSKQQNLEQICYENSQTQEQLQQCYENQSILEQESNGLQYYANTYEVLQNQFLQLFNNQAATKVINQIRRGGAQHKVEKMRQAKQEELKKQRNSAALILQCWARGLQPQEQLRLHKIEKLQNKSAVQVQSATRGFLARCKTAKLREQCDEQLRLQKIESSFAKAYSFVKTSADATADKEALRLEQSQRDKTAHAEKIEQEKKQKHQKNLIKRASLKQKKLDAQQAEEQERLKVLQKKEKEDLFFNILNLVIPAKNPMDAVYQQVDQSVVHGDSILEISKALRIAPFKDYLDNQLHVYSTSLISSSKHSFEKMKELINVCKLQKTEQLQAKMVEHEQLLQLLHAYKSLLDQENSIDLQAYFHLSKELVARDIAMRAANEDKGLPYFIACDAPYFIEISDLLEKWQYTLQGLTLGKIDAQRAELEKNRIKVQALLANSTSSEIRQKAQEKLNVMQDQHQKLLVQKDLVQWLQLVESIQGDGGVLHPGAILGCKVMQSLKSPDKYQYLSPASLASIRESFKQVVRQPEFEATKIFNDVAVVMQSAMAQLNIFEQHRDRVALDFVRGASLNLAAILVSYDDTLEKRLQRQYFDSFWRRNCDDKTGYSKAQIADLAKIHTGMIIEMLEADKKE